MQTMIAEYRTLFSWFITSDISLQYIVDAKFIVTIYRSKANFPVTIYVSEAIVYGEGLSCHALISSN